MPVRSNRPIRIVLFERDEATDTRAVTDIREFDRPARETPNTWTELAREKDRRDLIVALMGQVDQLLAGHIDEVSICLGG